MLKRGWTMHIVHLSSKTRKFTTSNIITLTATYLSVLHVKVSSFTAIKPRLPAKLDRTLHTNAQKGLETKWEGLVTILSLVSKLPRKWSPKKFLSNAHFWLPSLINSLHVMKLTKKCRNTSSHPRQFINIKLYAFKLQIVCYYPTSWQLIFILFYSFPKEPCVTPCDNETVADVDDFPVVHLECSQPLLLVPLLERTLGTCVYPRGHFNRHWGCYRPWLLPWWYKCKNIPAYRYVRKGNTASFGFICPLQRALREKKTWMEVWSYWHYEQCSLEICMLWKKGCPWFH